MADAIIQPVSPAPVVVPPSPFESKAKLLVKPTIKPTAQKAEGKQPTEPEGNPNQGEQPKTPEEIHKEKVSARYASLAQREKSLEERNRRFLEEKRTFERLKQENEEALKKINEFNELKKKAKENPLKYLEESGLNYDQLTRAALGQPLEIKPEDQTKMLEAKIDQMREEYLEREKTLEETRKKEKELEVKNWIEENRKKVIDFVNEGEEKYPLTIGLNLQHEVYGLIELVWQEKHQRIGLAEAADAVEKFLGDTVTSATKKTVVATKPEIPLEAETVKATPPSPGKTLSNKLTQTSRPAPYKREPRSIAMERAISMAEAALGRSGK
jgi:hypothetical protein